MSTKPAGKSSKFARYMKGPVKVLARARDIYVRSLTGCAGGVKAYGNVMGMGCNPPQFGSSPRSFGSSPVSYSSRDDDLSELIRIASTRSSPGGRVSSPVGGVAPGVTRSMTVAIGRIDEDKPCEFGGKRAELVCTRSRSLAVASR